MGLYKRGKIWYMRWTDAQGRVRRASSGSSDRAVAETLLARERLAGQQRAAGMRSASPLAAIRPIEEHEAAYLAAMEAAGLDRTYRENTRRFLKRMRQWACWRTAQDITRESIAEFLRLELAGRSRKTLENYHLAIAGFVKHLREGPTPAIVGDPSEGALATLRGSAARQARAAQVTRRPLTEAEVAALLTAPPPAGTQARGTSASGWPHRRRVYALVIGTGLRRAELHGLRRHHVKTEAARPFVEVPAHLAKSGRPRYLPVHGHLLELLRAWLGPIEPAAHFARPIPHVATLHADLERAGVVVDDGTGRRLDLHALRVTCCTRLATADVPIRVAQAFMGHQDIATTVRHYALVGRTELAVLAQGMPEISGLDGLHKLG